MKIYFADDGWVDSADATNAQLIQSIDYLRGRNDYLSRTLGEDAERARKQVFELELEVQRLHLLLDMAEKQAA